MEGNYLVEVRIHDWLLSRLTLNDFTLSTENQILRTCPDLPRAISLTLLDSKKGVIDSELVLFPNSYDVSSLPIHVYVIVIDMPESGSRSVCIWGFSPVLNHKHGQGQHLTKVSPSERWWHRLLEWSSDGERFRGDLESFHGKWVCYTWGRHTGERETCRQNCFRWPNYGKGWPGNQSPIYSGPWTEPGPGKR